MQYLKEDIRDNIIEAALSEFVEKDYSGASMRGIAEKAEITVGNIYRYFKNKEDLLEHCLKPLFNELDTMIKKDYLLEYGPDFEIPVREIIGKNIIEIFNNYPREFYIIRNGLKGTVFNTYYDNLVIVIVEKIKRVLSKQSLALHPMIYEIIARNQINAVIYILENAEKFETEEIINQFFSISFTLLNKNK